MSFACVMDASVGVKLFLSEPLTERAEALFAGLTEDPPAHLYVPDLFYAECANILWKQVGRYGYPANQARQDIEALARLPLRVAPARALATEALTLALTYGITAYDALYATLAQQVGAPLVTADDALTQRLQRSSIQVCRLQDWPAASRGYAP